MAAKLWRGCGALLLLTAFGCRSPAERVGWEFRINRPAVHWTPTLVEEPRGRLRLHGVNVEERFAPEFPPVPLGAPLAAPPAVCPTAPAALAPAAFAAPAAPLVMPRCPPPDALIDEILRRLDKLERKAGETR